MTTNRRNVIRRLFGRFVRDDRATTLLEYGLLTAAIGVSGLLVFATFQERMADSYNDWNDDVQEIWEPCPPGGCE